MLRRARSGRVDASTWWPIVACPTSGCSRPTSRRSRPWPTTTSSASRAPCADQELLVALCARDRAFGDAEDRPARLPGEPRGNSVDDFLVQFRLAHDAALAHPALADLELRLDQRCEMRPRTGE